MGAKTIGLREDTYDWLQARKRDDESFTELVDRLLDEATADWRDGFGTLPESEAEELERAVTQSREQLDAGLSTRQAEALGELSMSDDESDEAA